MRPCFHIEILTPKKFVLNGLWFGPAKAKRVVIWVHGLGSSMFGRLGVAHHIVDEQTALLVFNNRGHDKVARISQGKRSIRGGAAHEVFTDCVDDIQGAINFARRFGVRKIYLAGHSTGCQKSIYWAHKKRRGVRGIVILAPMSDYAAEKHISGEADIRKGLVAARKLVGSRQAHALLGERDWKWSLLADAQRFISLYSGTSAEEIFTYWDAKRNPRTLRSVKIPTLVLLAGKDEYADRPAKEIAAWFDKNISAPHSVAIVPRVEHGFKGGEKQVARAIRKFIS